MTDAALLQGYITQGDEAAFEAVVQRYGPMVWRVCREVLRDPHEAEDAFQATFLVLVSSAGSIRDQSALGRWLHGTALRIAVRARGYAMRRNAVAGPGVENAVAGALESAESRELRPLLQEEVGRLPERLREAVVLCYFEGLSQAEAASRLGCPVRTLKGRLSKARERLRSRLAKRGLVASAVLLLLLLCESEVSLGAIPHASTMAALGAAIRRRSLPETLPPSVARLVRGERRAVRARRATGLIAVGLSLLVLAAPSGRALLATTVNALLPRDFDQPSDATTGCHTNEPAVGPGSSGMTALAGAAVSGEARKSPAER